MGTVLLLIDPQVDFCDPSGSLFVPGADQDMARAAEWMNRSRQTIDAVMVTLDSHHVLDIAHPDWWIDAYGGHPVPFSTITLDDIQKGKFNVASEAMREATVEYLEHLAARGERPLTVWPRHCLLGSPGHSMCNPIREAVFEWESERATPVKYIIKGMNPFTEHHSAVQAEKIDPKDPSTALNGKMIHALDEHERIIVAGESQSHCVAQTVLDLMEHIDRSKFVLFEDGMSSRPGFEQEGTRFLYRAKGRGATITETAAV